MSLVAYCAVIDMLMFDVKDSERSSSHGDSLRTPYWFDAFYTTAVILNELQNPTLTRGNYKIRTQHFFEQQREWLISFSPTTVYLESLYLGRKSL